MLCLLSENFYLQIAVYTVGKTYNTQNVLVIWDISYVEFLLSFLT